MREELEAHVAMRAEHDRVDEAAARRRLGNLLHTRESMRRVWIAEWWDALRQDAHFTWRSWRRRPGVRAVGHPRAGHSASAPRRRSSPRSTACSSGRCRTRIPIASSPSGAITVPLVFRGQTEIDRRQVLRAGVGHDAGAVPVGDGDGRSSVPGRARSPRDSRKACGATTSSTTFCACWACASRWAATSRPRTTCAGRRRSRSSAMRCGSGASARIRESIDRTLSLERGVVAPAGPRHRRPAARTSRCRSRPPTSCSRLNCVPSIRRSRSARRSRCSHDSGRT